MNWNPDPKILDDLITKIKGDYPDLDKKGIILPGNPDGQENYSANELIEEIR